MKRSFCEALETRLHFSSVDDQISEAIALGSLTRTRIADYVISNVTDVDIYSFRVSDGQDIAFDLERPSGSLDSFLRIFDAEGNQLDANDNGPTPGESGSGESYLHYTFDDPGTYYVGVSAGDNRTYDPVTGNGDSDGGSTGRYTLVLIPPGDPDADDQIHQAHWLGAVTQTRTSEIRSIGAPTDVDLFSFSVSAGQKVSFDIDRPSGILDSYLRIFRSDGRELAANNDAAAPGESPTAEAYLEYTFTDAGMYYVGVSGHGNEAYSAVTGERDESGATGSYTLRLRKISTAPTPLLPDLMAWKSREFGYQYDYELDTTTQPGRKLLRFSTTSANIGAGPLELRGGDTVDDTQQVLQRIYDNQGGHDDRLAGEFIYHETHGHIHFADYARYKLRTVTPDGGVGEVVAGGKKVSFALLDTAAYDKSLPGARQGEHYTDAGQVQGLSVGWADVYEADLPDQWIDVTDLPRGEYWLDVVIDPKNHLLESNESNNLARLKLRLPSGDRDDEIDEAHAIGPAGSSQRVRGFTISNRRDVDIFSFTVDAGQRLGFDIDRPSFTLDSYIRIFDANGVELAANDDGNAPGEDGHDESYLEYHFLTGGTYYIGISGAGNSAYEPLTGRGDQSGSTASYTLRISEV